MVLKLLPLAVLAVSTAALAQNAPPAGGAPPAADGPGGAMMAPADRFKQLDKNADGKLNMEEFSAMQMRMGGGGPPGGAGGPPGGGGGPPGGAGGPPGGAGGPPGGGAMGSPADRFKAMDKNNDGSINLEEFSEGMQMRGGGGGGPPPGGG